MRRYLVAGLLVWVPVGATLLTFKFLLDLVDQLLTAAAAALAAGRAAGFPHSRVRRAAGPGGAVLTGLLVANLIGSTLVGWWEDLMNRIPLVRTIYSGFKGLTETLVTSKGGSFSKVVLVEYPRKEMWSIGFVTASDMPDMDALIGEQQVCVYVPTTPNPTSGLIVYVPASQVVESDMSVDAAMKMVVTMGIVMPPSKRPRAARLPANP